jgi:hypothetical protein
VLRPPSAKGLLSMFGGSGGGGGGTDLPLRSPAAAAFDAPPPPTDFWAGLRAFLEQRYGAAQGKALAAAFDTLHCAWWYHARPPLQNTRIKQTKSLPPPPPACPFRADSSVRALNYEDAEDLTKMLGREVGCAVPE